MQAMRCGAMVGDPEHRRRDFCVVLFSETVPEGSARAVAVRPTHHGHFPTYRAAMNAANLMVGILNDRIKSAGSYDDAYLRQLDANLYG